MKKISKIHLTFLTVLLNIFVLLSVLFGQKGNLRIAEYEYENVRFRAELQDALYGAGDTVAIKYQVENNSDKTAYIFDPDYPWNDYLAAIDYLFWKILYFHLKKKEINEIYINNIIFSSIRMFT